MVARFPRDHRPRPRDPRPAATSAGAGGAGDPGGLWEGTLSVGQLAAARFPKLVISGNHSRAFEAVCDALAGRLQARRAYVTGAGHATPDTGDAFNETLASFIGTSSPRSPCH